MPSYRDRMARTIDPSLPPMIDAGGSYGDAFAHQAAGNQAKPEVPWQAQVEPWLHPRF